MQGGVLGHLSLHAPEDLASGLARLDIMQDAQQHLASKGFVMPGKPQTGYDGTLPPDITTLDDDELGDLLSKLAEWIGYCDGQVTIADTARALSKERKEFAKARIRIAIRAEYGNKKLTATDLNDMTITQPDVVSATSSALYADAIYEFSKTIRDNGQRNWDTVSRRITQRGQEVERNKRDSNVGSTPAHFSRPYHAT